jgi:hypothetical protein
MIRRQKAMIDETANFPKFGPSTFQINRKITLVILYLIVGQSLAYAIAWQSLLMSAAHTLAYKSHRRFFDRLTLIE